MDLSSSELRARLINRGLHPQYAYSIVSHRDRSEQARTTIEHIISGRPFEQGSWGLLLSKH